MVITPDMTTAMVILVIPMVTITTTMDLLIDITIVTGMTVATVEEVKDQREEPKN
jgi:hypothetical protein